MMTLCRIYFTLILFSFTTLIHANNEYDAIEFRELNLSLISAAKDGDIDTVKQRLKEGASIKARNRFGNTALISATRAGSLDIVKLLIEKGANVNMVNTNAETALMNAASRGHDDILAYLIDNGADINKLSVKNL